MERKKGLSQKTTSCPSYDDDNNIKLCDRTSFFFLYFDRQLEPESTGFFEKRDKGAIDVASHDSVHGSDKLAANEDDRNNRGRT